MLVYFLLEHFILVLMKHHAAQSAVCQLTLLSAHAIALPVCPAADMLCALKCSIFMPCNIWSVAAVRWAEQLWQWGQLQ